MAESIDRFVELLERGDQAAAVRLVTAMAGEGATPESLVLDVLAPAQREVGRRWEDGRWSVAQEHAATAVIDAALGMLALEAEPTGVGHAVVACAEGEWHALPARMAAEVLRLRGWHVTFLGPSLPAEDLTRYLAGQRPDAVGLSASMPVSLKGAFRSIQACRAVSVPVLAGGAGFGRQGRHARPLGAAAWAPDPLTAARVLEGWLGCVPGVPRPTVPACEDHLGLERDRAAVVDAALAALGCDDAGAHAGARDAVCFLVAGAENAVFVGDPTVLADCRPAAERMLGGAAPVAAALEAVRAAVAERFPAAAALLAG